MLIRKSEERLDKALTEREWSIMLDIAKGKRLSQIALELKRSVKTIYCHRSKIMEKTGCKTNADLTIAAYKAGLLE